MKILIFIVSCFLTISILNAKDIKKSTETKTAVHESTRAVKSLVKTDVLKKKIKIEKINADKDIVSSSGTLKVEPKFEGKKKPEITTLAELRRLQNMEIVKLKKKQNKEVEAFGKNIKMRIKIKSEHRKVMKDLKLKHRAEQMEFKKAHPVKKDAKKKGKAEVKKKEAVK